MPHRIGTNFPTSPEYTEPVLAVMAQGIQPFAVMQAVGLDYVELALHHDPLDKTALQADIDRIHAHDLGVALHPYYKCAGFGTEAERSTIRANVRGVLEIAATVAQTEGRTIPINFHAGDGRKNKFSVADLMQHSDDFHHWLMETVDELGAEVVITTEFQLPPDPNYELHRIGDRFEELLLLKEEISHKRFGLCWDMGHSVMAHLMYHSPLLPQPDFLQLVRHVHIHDVDWHIQDDHRLIGTGDSPLGDFLQVLLTNGYVGNFTMEYSAKEFFNADYAHFLQQSKDNLLSLLTYATH